MYQRTRPAPCVCVLPEAGVGPVTVAKAHRLLARHPRHGGDRQAAVRAARALATFASMRQLAPLVSLPAMVLPDVREHLDKFVRDDPAALVFTGPKVAPLHRSNFRSTGGSRSKRPVSTAFTCTTCGAHREHTDRARGRHARRPDDPRTDLPAHHVGALVAAERRKPAGT
jgi:hypothetical protein